MSWVPGRLWAGRLWWQHSQCQSAQIQTCLRRVGRNWEDGLGGAFPLGVLATLAGL